MLAAESVAARVRGDRDGLGRQQPRHSRVRQLDERAPVPEAEELFGQIVRRERAKARPGAAGEDDGGALHGVTCAGEPRLADSAGAVASAGSPPGLRPTAMRERPVEGWAPSKAFSSGTSRSKSFDCAAGSPWRLRSLELTYQAILATRFCQLTCSTLKPASVNNL